MLFDKQDNHELLLGKFKPKSRVVYFGAFFLCSLVALSLGSISSHAQTATATKEDLTVFGRNPASVQNRILQQAEPKETLLDTPDWNAAVAPWYEFKDGLADDHGLYFGLFYAPMVQAATTTASNSIASGGTFNFDLAWTLFGRGTDHPGELLFRAQDRHPYSKVPPTLFFLETGSLWPTTVGYSPFDLSVLELAWQQHIVKERVIVRAGKMIPFAIHDYFRFKDPFGGFNDANLTANGTIPFGVAGLGFAGAIRPRDDIYIIAGLHDANGMPQRAGFDTFFKTKEYFTLFDIGWDPGYLNPEQAVYFGPVKVSDIHATIWHRDKLKKAGAPKGWGVTLFAEGEIGRYVPFIRAGYSDGKMGGPSILNLMIAGGVGIQEAFGQKNDVIGIGASWGKRDLGTIDTDFDLVPDLKVGNVSQFSSEVFYRIQLIKELAITPHVQVVINPALNPSENAVAVFGLRAKWAM